MEVQTIIGMIEESELEIRNSAGDNGVYGWSTWECWHPSCPDYPVRITGWEYIKIPVQDFNFPGQKDYCYVGPFFQEFELMHDNGRQLFIHGIYTTVTDPVIAAEIETHKADYFLWT